MNLAVFLVSILIFNIVAGGENMGISLYHRLFEKIEKDPMPLFDFGSDLDRIIQLNLNSDLENKILFEQYVERLSSHYYQEFVHRAQTAKNLQRVKVTQALIIKEFDTAVKAALPKSKQSEWIIIPFLQQLMEDTNSYIAEKSESLDVSSNVSPSIDASMSEDSGRLTWPRIKLAMRWILSQSILLLINFAQHEWFRRQNIRAVERRLAEVPEFPLL